MCVPVVFCRIESIIFLLPGISLPTLPHISQKNGRGFGPKCKKNHENTTVLNKQHVPLKTFGGHGTVIFP